MSSENKFGQKNSGFGHFLRIFIDFFLSPARINIFSDFPPTLRGPKKFSTRPILKILDSLESYAPETFISGLLVSVR